MTVKDLFPNVRPSFFNHFSKSKVLDPRFTYTRASTATYVDENGVLQVAAANQPRFDHDPVSGVCEGLLIESQRTNFLLWSRDLTQAAWTKVNASVALTATGADGTLNSASVITASAADAWVAQYGSTSTAGSHSISIMARRRTGTGDVRFSLGQNTGGSGVGPLLLNQDFSSAVGWTLTSAFSITGGQLVGTSAGTLDSARISLPVTMVQGLSYEMTYTIVSVSGAGVRPRFDGGIAVLGGIRTTPGTYSDILRMQNNTTWRIFPQGAGVNVVIDNLSIRPYMQPATTLTSQWQRFDLGVDTTTVNRPNPAVSIYLATSGDEIDIDFAQGEAGNFISSAIITTSAAATRAADSLTTTVLAPWFNNTTGTIIIQGTTLASGTQPMVNFDDNTVNEQIAMLTSGVDPKFTVTDGGTPQADLDAGTITANTRFKLAAAYTVNDFAACVNGLVVQADVTGTIPTVDRMRIGTDVSANQLVGYVERILYYPQRLTSSQLQSLTK